MAIKTTKQIEMTSSNQNNKKKADMRRQKLQEGTAEIEAVQQGNQPQRHASETSLQAQTRAS